MKDNARQMREAIAWHLRLSESEASRDWQQFTDWLAADEAHAAAYHAVARADSDLERLAGSEEMPAPPATLRWKLPALAGLAIAASIAVAVLFWPQQAPQLQIFETAAAARRTVALTDGSRIELNGGSRLALDPANPRFARLDRGEALFSVRHDEAKPFEVAVGDIRIVDRGTIFNIATQTDGLTVGVAEGAVRFHGYGQEVDLVAGRALRASRVERRIELRPIELAAVTDWRDGRLVYRNEVMATVAVDLARALGKRVEVEPGTKTMAFTGVIILRKDEVGLMAEVETLTGLRARRSDGGWLLGR